jgi:uncharacterized protein YegJ (DUF2314 family)
MKYVGDYKIEGDDGEIFLKVIEFPVPEEAGVGGESMWVRFIRGTENAGVGELNNNPAFCIEVSLGDHIEYAGGNSETKPHYVRRLDP